VQAIFTSGLQQGLLYCFMVLGVYITFRVLDFPDLTVDGSLPLGAAVTAAMLVAGHSPWLATAAGVGAGLCAGFVTGLLHLALKTGGGDGGANNYGPKLLAGILTMTALYTVNLRVMGKSNTPLLGVQGVFEKLAALLHHALINWWLIGALAVLAVAIKYLLDWFLKTEFGLTLRATGDNEQMIRAMGTNTALTRIAGLGIANALVALTGSLVAQQQGFADVGMGIGTIVAGLAGVIMGEVLFGERSVSWVLFSVIGGSIVYRLLIAVSLRLGIAPTDLKLLTAVLVVVALSIPTVRRKVVRA
jgi:putative tryptophan/tyrosine transport system permease protein